MNAAAPDANATPAARGRAARDEARAVHRRLLEVDPRVRTGLAAAIGCGALAASLLVLQAWVIADAVTDAVAGRAPTGTALALLGLAVAGRVALGAGTELAGRWAARRAMASLRVRIADAALRGRSAPLEGARRGEVVAAATQGVDALADYYARAVPAVALAGAVPLGLVAVVTWRAPLVGALLACTLPIVVVFLALVGRRSAEHARERQHQLAVLGAHFLEVVRGLPTLRAHGREHAQVPALRTIAERYRDESLAALRVAFLSALVLELLAMLGTAIAAAVVGVQLAEGHLTLGVGLFVLLLAPEVYAPLREAGQRFHAAEDGAEAARRALAFLDEPGPLDDRGTGVAAPDPSAAALRLRGAAVRGGGGRADALAPLDLDVAPGRTLAIVGPSGSGKSTLLELLARLRDPDVGTVRCGGTDLRALPPEAWWRRVAWLAQRPTLPAGELGALLRTMATAAGAGPDDVRRLGLAVHRAGADEVLAELPDDLRTPVGAGGRTLSAGQLQRLCLAGALASRAPLLLLDEPTAHLDPATAERVRDGIVGSAAGRTLVVATHDAELAAACDAVVTLVPAGAVAGAAVTA
jgi:thiol reductant ABC exporter CydD subunit